MSTVTPIESATSKALSVEVGSINNSDVELRKTFSDKHLGLILASLTQGDLASNRSNDWVQSLKDDDFLLMDGIIRLFGEAATSAAIVNHFGTVEKWVVRLAVAGHYYWCDATGIYSDEFRVTSNSSRLKVFELYGEESKLDVELSTQFTEVTTSFLDDVEGLLEGTYADIDMEIVIDTSEYVVDLIAHEWAHSLTSQSAKAA
ncbi:MULTISPECIES: hypothetical protein [Vibrio]|uniref:Uncharacterized protein n=1 Tax=Vibrio tasmaniensis TaxID=212663 RepID=A0A2N7NN95_9VIBR|nr:hypothetical protein [Vibrio tasmaniensis]PMO89896.1 hypothetical protein BCT01_01030 [Vibrio tasmaniensis]PMP17763.1 hypothetical protein BCS92_04985 [Vibrio tasmaniensis]TKG28001.1 hypothetical protein FC057_22705 [Vibrio tasmaniensis]TKG41634.1 hypothetical protein FC063_07165 [Vibrio tasmaniensis]TKG44878.1 hypothetical protein FC061_20300 [Vibrio tasmaniensis]